ncbi:glycosyltransferase family 2 protein [Aeromonas caviae]
MHNTLIVILNWNGSLDTVACCQSLVMDDGCNADILVIDNGSEDADYDFLKENIPGTIVIPSGYNDDTKVDALFLSRMITDKFNYDTNIFLIRSSVNHGFAKGCNIGADYAALMGYEYVMFLNNDTVVEPGFLEQLIVYLDKAKADVVIPQIRYFFDKTKIWNCGGKIDIFGRRKYHYSNQDFSEVQKKPFKISFATGCCILFRTDYFNKIGQFCEKFFFGEEDIDLSLRLLKLNARVYCVPASVIYHKVGASLVGDNDRLLNKAYIHYLNRFVNMKNHLHLIWWVWLLPSFFKVIVNVIKINKLDFINAIFFAMKLVCEARELDGVSKSKFEDIIINGYRSSHKKK